MYCSNCGKKIPDSSSFCPYCGKSVKAASPVTAAGKAAAGQNGTDFALLVEGVRKNDQNAIAVLYDATAKKALYIARDMLKDEDMAEDVLQDSYVKAFSSLDLLSNPAGFQPWFDTIVINKCRDELRKKKPVLFSAMASDDDNDPTLEFEDTGDTFSPEANVDYSETQRIIREMIDSLSDPQRIATTLYYLEGMSTADIAKVMGCSEGTIKSRLSLARGNIKKQVEALEKQGTKLYCVPFLPFLYWLFRQIAGSTRLPVTAAQAAGTIAGALSGAAGHAASGALSSGTAAGTAQTSGTMQASGAANGTLGRGGFSGSQYPNGQFQNAQYPSGQFQNPQYTNGQFQNAQYPNGQFQNPQYPNGQFRNAQYPNGQFQNTQYQYPNGQYGSSPYQSVPSQGYIPQNPGLTGAGAVPSYAGAAYNAGAGAAYAGAGAAYGTGAAAAAGTAATAGAATVAAHVAVHAGAHIIRNLIIVAVIAAAGFFGARQFVFTPEKTIQEFEEAYNSQDYKGLIATFDSKTRNMIGLEMGVATQIGSMAGIDIDEELVSNLFGVIDLPKIQIKVLSKTNEGSNKCTLHVQLLDEDGKVQEESDVPMVREKMKWYIDMSSAMNLSGDSINSMFGN